MTASHIPKPFKLAIADLVAYEHQPEFFGVVDAQTDARVRQSLLADGQRDPIVVVRRVGRRGKIKYTILDGHRRVRLMKQFGHTHVIAIIRDDLQTAEEIEAAYLTYNPNRGQMPTLCLIRITKRQLELVKGRAWNSLTDSQRTELKDTIAKSMKMSPRNVARYISVLSTPKPIQDAVEREELRLTLGAQIAMLPQEKQQEIADTIATADTPTKINDLVANLLDASTHRQPRPVRALDHLAHSLQRAIADLGDRVDSVRPHVAQPYINVLGQGEDLLHRLKQRATEAQ